MVVELHQPLNETSNSWMDGKWTQVCVTMQKQLERMRQHVKEVKGIELWDQLLVKVRVAASQRLQLGRVRAHPC